MSILLCGTLLSGSVLQAHGVIAKVGETLPDWSEGTLDIHAINTARGECTFFILPDGTTMVVDAGEFIHQSKKMKNDAQRPNEFTRPADTFANYIRHFSPRKDSIDYFMVSHYHMDHMGQMEPEYSVSSNGNYIESGVTALYDRMPFRMVIDRAYPDIDAIPVAARSEKSLANYRKFLETHVSKGKLRAEALKLGSENQIALRYKPQAYPDCKVKNLCANGKVWKDGKLINCYTNATLRENGASCGFLLSYGDFDYVTAGDLNGGDLDTQSTLAEAVGKEIEATKSNHHLSPKTMNERTMELLNPQVMVTQSFYVREIQPDQSIIQQIAKTGTKQYFTNIDQSLLDAFPEIYKDCTQIGGHVVIRVLPGGKEYYVIMLDDTDNAYKVRSIDGPFKCK